MYVQTIRRLLALAPAGLSNEQLLWRLRSAGLRLSPEDILQSLTELAQSGTALRTPAGRWQLTAMASSAAGAKPPSSATAVGAPEPLLAVRMTAETQPPADSLGDETDGHGIRADADWRNFVRYYAATQRSDPRGTVTEFADRHATSRQLVWSLGDWWSPGRLRLPLATCPATFRQAIHRRPEKICAIGYPLGRSQLVADRAVYDATLARRGALEEQLATLGKQLEARASQLGDLTGRIRDAEQVETRRVQAVKDCDDALKAQRDAEAAKGGGRGRDQTHAGRRTTGAERSDDGARRTRQGGRRAGRGGHSPERERLQD